MTLTIYPFNYLNYIRLTLQIPKKFIYVVVFSIKSAVNLKLIWWRILINRNLSLDIIIYFWLTFAITRFKFPFTSFEFKKMWMKEF